MDVSGGRDGSARHPQPPGATGTPQGDGLLDAAQHLAMMARQDGFRRVAGRPDARWRSLSASVWRKGDVEKHVPASEAHVLLACLGGQRRGMREGDALGGRIETTYRRDSFCFCPAGHAVSSAFRGEVIDLHIMIPRPVMDGAVAAIADRAQGAEAPRGFGFRRDPRLSALASVVKRELADPSPASDLLIDGVAIALAGLLAASPRTSRRAASERAATRLDPVRLQRVLERIEAGLEETLSLADLAAEIGLSSYHFARAFRAATGVAPHQHVGERRIARACAMLAAGDAALAEIAYACGFSSQSHMTSSFSRRLGISPGRYRTQARS